MEMANGSIPGLAGIKERLQLIFEWLQVSGKPIKLVGRGERMEDLEPFYPDRMAGRILGMGDVLSFVEKAQEVVSFGKFHFIFILKGRKKKLMELLIKSSF